MLSTTHQATKILLHLVKIEIQEHIFNLKRRVYLMDLVGSSPPPRLMKTGNSIFYAAITSLILE